jgi:hypothetical protein
VYRLEKMANYETWREAWNAQNPSKDSCLKRIHDKRDTDVHEGGSGPIVRLKQIKVGVGDSYSDKSGTLESWGTPSPLIDVDTGATIYVPQHFFDIDGTERPVTEVCAEYLTALEQMVAQYEADTSPSLDTPYRRERHSVSVPMTRVPRYANDEKDDRALMH